MRPAKPTSFEIALTAAAAVVLSLSAAHFSVHTGDDGFIFLRYAERFATGAGWGFSDGVAPLEGFSSPLWVALLTLLHAFGLTGLWSSKLLSAASLGLLLAGVWALVRALGGRVGHAAAALLALGLLRPPMFWAFSGLETPLSAALLVWTAWGLVLGRGRYAPTAAAGRALLHHELTHVAQQARGHTAPAASQEQQAHHARLVGERQSAVPPDHLRRPAGLSQQLPGARVVHAHDAHGIDGDHPGTHRVEDLRREGLRFGGRRHPPLHRQLRNRD